MAISTVIADQITTQLQALFDKKPEQITSDSGAITEVIVTVNGTVTNNQHHGLVPLSAQTGVELSSRRSGTGQRFSYSN